MSKNFEKEYIEMAQNEIPDLWDRIEAGLTGKSAPEKITKNNTKKLIPFRRYAGLAAAILCVAIIIPASKLIRQSSGNSYSADTATYEESYSTTTEAYDAAAEAETCEEEYDTDAVKGTSEDGAATSGTEALEATEAAAEMYDTSEIDFAAEKSENAASSESRASLAEEEDSEKKFAVTILKNVTVQVTEENNDVYREDGSPLGGTVYTVLICEDASGTLEKGEQIEIYLSGDSSIIMSVGEEFNIDIACEEDGEYQYVVDRIYSHE